MLSSGPCKKFQESPLFYPYQGRSMRSTEVKQLINDTLKLIHQHLKLPEHYRVCMTSGSNTGAIEMAFWNLIGPLPVKCYVTDPFSKIWSHDLKALAADLSVVEYDYGYTPTSADFSMTKSTDLVFVLNQTASGCYHRNLDWIPDSRKGLVFADATSIAFADYINWNKLDVISLSFQKVLGGEAGVGILILSPTAIRRLENYTPVRAIPNLFRLKNTDGSIRWNIFKDYPINTLSVAAIYEVQQVLKKYTLKSMHDKCVDNYNLVKTWVEGRSDVEFLIKDTKYQSLTVQCLVFKREDVKTIIKMLERKGIYDISPYPGLPENSIRIWTGPTVTTADLTGLIQLFKND